MSQSRQAQRHRAEVAGMRRAIALLAAGMAVLAWPTVASAELPDPGKNTVGLGPAVSSSTSIQGSAGYDQSGTHATAESHGTSAAPPAYQSPDRGYTYREIPYNAVVVPAPSQLDNYGVIHVQQGAGQAA